MITVIGELLVDLIDEAQASDARRPGAAGDPVARPGGSPANVAVALARLGRPVNLLTQLGDDEYGRFLRGYLADNGVGLAPGTLLACPRTSTARTSLSIDGQATYTFDVAWSRFAAGLASRRPDPTVTAIHTGSLATVLPPGADDVAAIIRAARPTSIVSFDPNCRPSLAGDRNAARERVTAMVAESDIVKASVEDLAWLYPGRPCREVCRDWLGRGAALVVVTLGGAGAWASTAQHRESTVDARSVTVVDTVGAGDAFTAGLLFALERAGLLHPKNRAALAGADETVLAEVLRFASEVAAITCGRRGANPPTLADVAASSSSVAAADASGAGIPHIGRG